MVRIRAHLAMVMTLGLALAAGEARADDPKFEQKEGEEAEAILAADSVEWKASAQAGLILTTGNSRITTLSAGARASRKAGKNKVQVEGSGAFARSSVFLAIDDNGNGVVDENEFERLDSTTTKLWLFKARYDRFLTERNSVYAAGIVNADEPAGKEFVGGGQFGYSRTLIKTEVHDIKIEAGYDFSYEDLTSGDEQSIHSARGFLGYEGKLSEDTGLSGAGEILVNLNELDVPPGDIGRFDDTRFNGMFAITTKMFEDVSFRFSFTAKYDNAPAPRAPFAIPFADGFVPLADKLDTLTEASLIVSFL